MLRQAGSRRRFALAFNCVLLARKITRHVPIYWHGRGQMAAISSFTDEVGLAIDKVQTVVTDVWISMGNDEGSRRADFAPFQVNAELMRPPLVMLFSCIACQHGAAWK
jgi:hypothetical protein